MPDIHYCKSSMLKELTYYYQYIHHLQDSGFNPPSFHLSNLLCVNFCYCSVLLAIVSVTTTIGLFQDHPVTFGKLTRTMYWYPDLYMDHGNTGRECAVSDCDH